MIKLLYFKKYINYFSNRLIRQYILLLNNKRQFIYNIYIKKNRYI